MESLTHTFMSGSQESLPNITFGPEGVHDTALTTEEALSQMSPQDPRRGGSNPNMTPDVVVGEPDRVASFDLSNEVTIDI